MSKPQKVALLGIVTAFLVLGACYSFVNPPFESPDEVWHYAYVREIVLNHGLPVLVARTPQPWEQEGAQAPLYYLIGAGFISWIDPSSLAMPAPNPFAHIGEPRAATNDNRNAFFHDRGESFPYQGTTLALHVLRLYSVLLGGLTVALTFALAYEVFPDSNLIAPISAAFVAFLPQFVFISSSVNNDNLATLLSTAMLWCLAKLLRRGISLARSLQVGLVAGAALLTKFNTATLVALAVIVLLFIAVQKRAWRSALVSIAIIGLITALMTGWWYLRNIVLYGDPSGMSLIIQMIGSRSAPIDPLRWFLAENEGLRLSIWGVFGWMNVLAAPAYYSVFDILALVGVLGMAVTVVRCRVFSPTVAMLALWCLITFAGVVYYNLQLPASQGRLLFPALAAWAVLWGRGIAALIPGQVQKAAVTALAAGQMLVATLTPALAISPAYIPSNVTSLPRDAIPINASFSNGVKILGVRIDRAEVRPGDALNVTVYTSLAEHKMAQAALFVHIANSDNIVIAQRDSAIASGNWSGVSYPTIVADSLPVEIPVTAPVPDSWRVQVGIYDLNTHARWTVSETGSDLLTVGNLAARSVDSGWGFDFDGHTVLNQAEILPRSGRPGSRLRVILHLSAAPDNYRVFAHALGEADHIWASADESLKLSTDLDLSFATDTPPGVYPIELGIYPVDGDRLPVFDAHGQLVGDRLFLGPVRINP